MTGRHVKMVGTNRAKERAEEKAGRKMKDIDMDDIEVFVSEYGDMKICYKDDSIEIDRPMVAVFLQKVNDARLANIKMLKSTLAQLEGIDAGIKVDITTAVSATGETSKPVVTTSKEYTMGFCYTCDGKINSNQGQPCVICKNTSHKKCLDTAVCGICMGEAEQD